MDSALLAGIGTSGSIELTRIGSTGIAPLGPAASLAVAPFTGEPSRVAALDRAAASLRASMTARRKLPYRAGVCCGSTAALLSVSARRLTWARTRSSSAYADLCGRMSCRVIGAISSADAP